MANGNEVNPLVRIISLLKTGPMALVLRFQDQFTRISTGAPARHLSEITPQVYVGGQHRPQGWAKMQADGITAVVNMREAHHDDQAAGIAPTHYLHLPTRDNRPISQDDFAKGVDFITQEVDAGGVVYIHCGVGVGRAPLMAAAYFISTGLTPDEALAKIKAVRPFIHPTPGQRKQLERFAESLQS